MQGNKRDKRIIEQYKQDEKTMILAFVKWCDHHHLNPFTLYERAYPEQAPNKLLKEIYSNTTTEKEVGKISSDALVQLLHMFGNVDLAFVVQEESEKITLKNHDQNI